MTPSNTPTADQYIAEVEDLLRAGVTDGIPVVLPWSEGVQAMVAGSGRSGDEQVAGFGAETFDVRDIAEQALMAGCLPTYMPVVLAAVEALAGPQMDTERWVCSAAGLVPWVVVSGPISDRLEMNRGCDAFGPGNHANAAIGRAIRLCVRHLADGTLDQAALGNGYAFSCAIPDDEESFPFSRLSKSYGLHASDSAVVVMWTSCPRLVNNTCSRDPSQLLLSLAKSLATLSEFDPAWDSAPRGKAVVALGYDLQEILHDAGWDRADVQRFVATHMTRHLGDARRAGLGVSSLGPAAGLGVAGLDPAATPDDELVHLGDDPDDVVVVRVGGPGAIGLSTVARIVSMDVRRVTLPDQTVGRTAFPPAGTPDPIRAVYSYVERGFTDGWPIVPPTNAMIRELISASGRDEDELLGTFAYAGTPVTVKDLAVNAALAGALPEYMPLLVAAMEMVVPYGHGYISVSSWSPWLVINGPLGRQLGLPSATTPFGPSAGRAAITIGRALRLAIMNIGQHRPGQPYDRAVQGQGWKYTITVLAEDELDSEWEPLHVSLGFDAQDDVLTFVTGALGHSEVTYSGPDPEALLMVLADDFVRHDPWGTVTQQSGRFTPRRDAFFVIGPDHRRLLQHAGWDRRTTQEFLYERIGAPLGDIRAEGYAWEGRFPDEAPDDLFVRALEGPESIMLVAAGGPGPHSMSSSMRMHEAQGRVPATTTQKLD